MEVKHRSRSVAINNGEKDSSEATSPSSPNTGNGHTAKMSRRDALSPSSRKLLPIFISSLAFGMCYFSWSWCYKLFRQSVNAPSDASSIRSANNGRGPKNELVKGVSSLKTSMAKPSVALPNVLVMEAGTSAVSDWLFDVGACHPQVFPDEPPFMANAGQFFDRLDRYNQGIDFIIQRYQHCLNTSDGNKGILLDASSYTIEFPQRVFDLYNSPPAKDAMKQLKLIFVLRDPLERELFQYNLKKKGYDEAPANNKLKQWFSEAVHSDGQLMTFDEYSLHVLRKYIQSKSDYYKGGLYGLLLKEWITLFQRSRILVLSYDEVKSDAESVKWRIQQFLQTKLEGGGENNLAKEGGRDIDSKDLPKRSVRLLEPLFRESNAELYELLAKSRPTVEQPFPKFPQRIAKKTNFDMVLPNILLIGCQKAGTSAIAEWMFLNSVCSPTAFYGEPYFYNKEVHFFDHDDRYQQGIQFYSKRFEQCIDVGLDEFMMDATPNTFDNAERVHEIYSLPEAQGMLKKVKLIVILRDPIDRELSAYNHKVFDYKADGQKGFVKGKWYNDVLHSNGTIKTFTEYAGFVRDYYLYESEVNFQRTDAKYVRKLREWIRLFDRSQLLILSYNELRSDPSKLQWRIEQFLGTKFQGTLATANDSGGASKLKKDQVPQGAIDILSPVFHDANEELYDFLDQVPGPPMEQRPFLRFDDRVTSKE